VREGDYLPSTATDLDEIQLSAAMSEEEQIAEVKRRAHAWINEQSEIDGGRLLLPGYGTHRYDCTRSLEFNHLSYNTAGETSAVMHRPLTAGAPWMLDLPRSSGCV
jgi:hypothetical protein